MLNHSEILKHLDRADSYARMIISENTAIRKMLDNNIGLKKETETEKVLSDFKLRLYKKSLKKTA